MTDLELAVRAARSAGLPIEYEAECDQAFDDLSNEWDPRKDDGDALRLAVALKMHVDHDDKGGVTVYVFGSGFEEPIAIEHEDVDASGCSTRNAIFCAAVKSGALLSGIKQLPEPASEPLFDGFEDEIPY